MEKTIKKNKRQKEGSSHSQVTSFVTSLAGSVRDKVTVIPNVAAQHVPDGTKQKITIKKTLKNGQDVSIAPEDVSENKYIYVYGITNNDALKVDIIGLKYQPIQKFEIKDLTVLFSFYPTLYPAVEEKEALLHAEILSKLANKTTIVPMAFGTVFKDQGILKTVLTSSYPSVKKALELIKDKMELGVKVIKNEEIPGEVSREILEELNKLSVKSVAGNKFSERLLLNNSFLVEKNKFGQFSQTIGELEQKHQNLKFIYSGPWPAYSFVDINIKVG